MKRIPSTANRRDPSTVAVKGDHVQSLLRALNIINCLSQTEDGISLTEVAQQLGLSTSTAHRLLTTLMEERYVHFDAERRLWSVGMQAFVVGNAFLKTRSLVGVARPFMRALMEETGETVNLAVEDEMEAVYLTQVECRQMMRAFGRPGARVVMHGSSVGKALLSFMSERDLSKVLHQKGMPRLTVKTLKTTSALREDLIVSRMRGYAIDDEEHAVGLRCVAAAIFNESQEPVAALSVSGPMARIPDERMQSLGELVRVKAEAITQYFGGKSPLRKQ